MRKIERGEFSAQQFINELKELVNEVVLNVLRDNSSTMIQVQADEPAKKQKSTAEKKPRKPRLKSIEEIACPKCGKGHIIKGRTAYGCSEFRNGCDILLPFDSYPADLTPASERVITIAYYALVRLQEVTGGDDAARAEWYALDKVPALAFDHDQILRMASYELKRQIHFEPVGFELLPKQFTIKELQSLYESILDVTFDRRNFYKKMQHLELLKQVDRGESKPRQPFLFEFNAEKYAELKHKGFRLEF